MTGAWFAPGSISLVRSYRQGSKPKAVRGHRARAVHTSAVQMTTGDEGLGRLGPGARPAGGAAPRPGGQQPAPETSKAAFLHAAGSALRQLRLEARSPHDAEILLLFLPALVALVLEPVQQMADTIIIGRLGVAQLGAAGLGTVLFQFSLGFLSSLVFATTPRVADAVAARDYRKVGKARGLGSMGGESDVV